MGQHGKTERFHNIRRRVVEGINHSIQDKRKFKKGGQESTNQEKEERPRDRLEQLQEGH